MEVVQIPVKDVTPNGWNVNRMSQSMRAKLRPFGSVTPGTVLLTIVQPGSLSIVATVSEKSFPQIHDGLTATIRPTGDTELEWEGNVAHVETVPISRGKFPLRIDFQQISRQVGRPDVSADLAVINVNSVYELLDCLVVGEAGMRTIGGVGPLNTDDRPCLEFGAAIKRDNEQCWIDILAAMSRNINI